ncbi:MAG: twin-arginine translocase TatA/TatE family subunit [Alphaproteobacteria bacterium]|nr:twin-arginine translocase TatA/TatE family subunit [Alphaproteobacteria bacterium]
MELGFSEILLVVVVILILFGAGKLPTVMHDLGKGIRQFKEGVKDVAAESQHEPPGDKNSS